MLQIYQDPVLSRLEQKAASQDVPLIGGFELVPTCNMRCNMCYIQENSPEIQKNLLSGQQWLEIIKKCCDAGSLFVLLTGGEPLLHPDFRQIYLGMLQMGLAVSVNTNGTLIDENWADFFSQNRCKKLNITLYGSSNETYDRLCHNPQGFTQTIKAMEHLHARGVPFRINITATKENVVDLPDFAKIAERFDTCLYPTTYLYPLRHDDYHLRLFNQSRLTPQEAARANIFLTLSGGSDRAQTAEGLLARCFLPPCGTGFTHGLPCKGGHSSYAVSWTGSLKPCNILETQQISLLTTDFQTAWKQLSQVTSAIPRCTACDQCRKKHLCHSCTAACVTETGCSDIAPQYLCEMTDEMLRILLTWLAPERQNIFLQQLQAVGLLSGEKLPLSEDTSSCAAEGA